MEQDKIIHISFLFLSFFSWYFIYFPFRILAWLYFSLKLSDFISYLMYFPSYLLGKYEGKYIKYLQVTYLSIMLNICWVLFKQLLTIFPAYFLMKYQQRNLEYCMIQYDKSIINFSVRNILIISKENML